MPKIIRLETMQLLRKFDHVINFPQDWDFVILHGPNGIGKTKLLEVINHLFSLNLTKLYQIPFTSVIFTFDNGSTMSAHKESCTPPTRKPSPFPQKHINNEAFKMTVKLKQPDSEPIEYDFYPEHLNQSNELVRYIERIVPIKKTPRGGWLDMRTGQDYPSLLDVSDAYPGLIPIHILEDEFIDDSPSAPPQEIQSFCNNVAVHIISTHRLQHSEAPVSVRSRLQEISTQPKVVNLAANLRKRLQAALADNSRTTQMLDRTFPRRIFDSKIPSDVTDEKIREKYEEQNRVRSRLSQITLLEDRPDLPLPETKLADWQRRVLWTYLIDTDEKLKTFQTLMDKVETLRKIVTSRFLHKSLSVDSEEGFKIITDDGIDIPLTQLSSGEQHELILIYDLLFNADKNSLVLIDEPEISLHVAWQQRFLDDLSDIAKLSDLRFIIATHSPHIIHKSWEKTVRLAPQHDSASVTRTAF